MSKRYKVILSIKDSQLRSFLGVLGVDNDSFGEEEAQNSDDAAFADDVDVIDVFEEEG